MCGRSRSTLHRRGRLGLSWGATYALTQQGDATSLWCDAEGDAPQRLSWAQITAVRVVDPPARLQFQIQTDGSAGLGTLLRAETRAEFTQWIAALHGKYAPSAAGRSERRQSATSSMLLST